jgi:hypothetical protein
LNIKKTKRESVKQFAGKKKAQSIGMNHNTKTKIYYLLSIVFVAGIKIPAIGTLHHSTYCTLRGGSVA